MIKENTFATFSELMDLDIEYQQLLSSQRKRQLETMHLLMRGLNTIYTLTKCIHPKSYQVSASTCQFAQNRKDKALNETPNTQSAKPAV